MFFHSIRHGFRMLFRHPAAFGVAIAALALGIGASTAVFTVVDAIVFRPLPYADAPRLVAVWDQLATLHLMRFAAVQANFADYKQRNHVFTDMAAYEYDGFTVSFRDMPERTLGMRMTANLFTMLGAKPLYGRLLLPEENVPGRDTSAVLSWALWQKRFGGNPDVVGKTIMVDGSSVWIVGILPKNFRYIREADAPEIFLPLPFRPDPAHHYGNVRIVAKLKRGVTLQQARSDMRAVAASVDADFHPYRGPNGENAGYRVLVLPLQEEVFGNMRLPLLIMFWAVCLVLLIACVNVSNLLLARAAGREREIATRIAIGANRRHLLQQLLTESIPLACLSALIGIGLSILGVKFLLYITPPSVPRPTAVGLDYRILGFTVLLAIAASAILGMAPALFAMRTDPNAGLRSEGHSSGVGKRRGRFSQAFVTLQVALSVTLVLAAGLVLTSFFRLRSVSPGFNPSGLYTARVSLPDAAYRDNGRVASFYRDLNASLQTIPAVRAAGVTSRLPISGGRGGDPFSLEGRAYNPNGPVPQIANYELVSPSYFDAAQIPLRAGRLIDARDGDNPVADINETLAKGFWPNGDPIGHQILMGAPTPEAHWMTIVGVVGDVKNSSLDVAPLPQIYRPFWQDPARSMAIAIRTFRDPLEITSAVPIRVLALDRQLPVYDVETMQERVDSSTAFPEFQALMLGILAGMALLLAAIGVYGMMAESVAERRFEIGVRSALGARPNVILLMFIRRGLLLTALGAVLGAVGMVAVRKIIARLLFGTGSADPLTIIGVIVLLTAVAGVACLLGARSAVRADPIQTLRYN